MLQLKMSERGRVVIPVEIRQALALKEGGTVLWELHDGEARMTTRAQRIRRAQAARSPGDRACLALARAKNAEVLTADKPWLQVAKAVGIEVRCSRREADVF